jgi:hypothetical protein
MTPNPQIGDLDDRLQAALSPAEIRAVLATVLDRIGQEPDSKTWKALLDRVVQAIHDVTAADPEAAAQAILSDLVPLCLGDALRDPHDRSKYRRFCVEWVGELPDQTRTAVRADLCAAAVTALTTTQVENALGLISVLGYADPNVVSALGAMVRSGPAALGDRVLSVLVRLCPDPAHTAGYRAELHGRMPIRWNSALANVATEVGDRETLDLVFDHWLGAARSDAPLDSEPWLLDHTIGLAATISAKFSSDGLPTRTWHRVLGITTGPHESVTDAIHRSGTLAARFYTPAVIPELVRWAGAAEGLWRYSLYSQLTECARPEHLPGWDQVSASERRPVESDALAKDTQKGNWVTVELRQKMEAWRVLLSCGRPEFVPSFDDTLAAEENGYVTGELLELAACVPPGRLPGRVEVLLRSPAEMGSWTENEILAAQVAAIQAAHGAGSIEAFEALFSFQPVGGRVLVSLIRALAETAAGLARTGVAEPTERLFTAAEGRGEDHTREAAGGAVGHLLAHGMLTAADTARAARMSVNPAVDPFSRRELLFTLARRSEVDVPTGVLDSIRLVALGRHPLTAEELRADLRRAAIAVVSSRVAADSDPEFATQCLSVRQGTAGYEYAGDPGAVGQVVYAIALQFERAPDRFVGIVASFVRTAPPAAVAQLLPAIRRIGSELSDAVRAALSDRVRLMASGRTFEPAVLQGLADISPPTLVETMDASVDGWMPQARAAVAEVLERVGPSAEPFATRRFELLVRLAGDGLYAVRRNAYRALAAVDPDRFAALLASWAAVSGPEGEGLRRRSAEGAGWLPELPSGGRIESLAWDVEPSVREAYARAATEGEERRIAVKYEAHVLSVRDPSQVVAAWRYGAALGRFGDDRTVESLDAGDRPDLPPAVRYWFERVRKAVKKRWDEATRKWPEPWVTRRGFLEPFAGVVRGADGREAAVQGLMWRTTPELPNSYYGWGGWGEGPVRAFGDHELLIAGRGAVPILVTSSNFASGPFYFAGNGPYPGDATVQVD